jgi:hypothetical protein
MAQILHVGTTEKFYYSNTKLFYNSDITMSTTTHDTKSVCRTFSAGVDAVASWASLCAPSHQSRANRDY